MLKTVSPDLERGAFPMHDTVCGFPVACVGASFENRSYKMKSLDYSVWLVRGGDIAVACAKANKNARRERTRLHVSVLVKQTASVPCI